MLRFYGLQTIHVDSFGLRTHIVTHPEETNRIEWTTWRCNSFLQSAAEGVWWKGMFLTEHFIWNGSLSFQVLAFEKITMSGTMLHSLNDCMNQYIRSIWCSNVEWGILLCCRWSATDVCSRQCLCLLDVCMWSNPLLAHNQSAVIIVLLQVDPNWLFQPPFYLRASIKTPSTNSKHAACHRGSEQLPLQTKGCLLVGILNRTQNKRRDPSSWTDASLHPFFILGHSPLLPLGRFFSFCFVFLSIGCNSF